MSGVSVRGIRESAEHPRTWGDGFGVLLDDREVDALLAAADAIRFAPCERALHGVPECGTADPETEARFGHCGRCAAVALLDFDEGDAA